MRRIAQYIAGDIVMSDKPGLALRKWRELFAASQVEVARHMGVTSSVISDYEKGRRHPGSMFVKRFVEALLEIDGERGSPVARRLARILQLHYLGPVVDMRDFEAGVPLDAIIDAVRGVPVNSFIPQELLYGYTVIDSVRAIMMLSGNEFLYLLGSTTQRVVVFTKVTTGRSPMIALRVSTIKPAVIVLHGPKRLDPLAVWIAERENIPVVHSMSSSVEELLTRLQKLSSSPQGVR